MGGRALLAAVSLLAAQTPYRPWVLGITALPPVGKWGMRYSFPEGARFAYSVGVIGAKEYYNRSGTLGWCVFFQAMSWVADKQGLLSDILRMPVTGDSTDFTRLRMPFSNVGGVGLVFRQKLSPRAFLAIPADIRIIYVSYRRWSVAMPSGTQYDILIESNSFIGAGITPTVWFNPEKDGQTLMGIGVGYPIVWGRPSYYAVNRRTPDGQTTTERNSYYIVPRYVEVRLVVSFVP